MKKRILTIIFLSFCFLINFKGVKAYTDYSKEEGYELVCQYTMTYNDGEEKSSDINVYRKKAADEYSEDMFAINWENIYTGSKYDKAGTKYGTFGTQNGKNVYFQDYIMDSFSCPENAYIDMNGADSLCFDNNGKYCVEKNNSFHEFGSASDKFVNTKKVKDNDGVLAESERDPDNDIYYEEVDCGYLFGNPENADDPAYWIQKALTLIKYIAIIAVLLLSTLDFIKAIVEQKPDAVFKAAVTAGKRFIFAVLIFFLPMVMEVIMELIGAYGTCGFE